MSDCSVQCANGTGDLERLYTAGPQCLCLFRDICACTVLMKILYRVKGVQFEGTCEYSHRIPLIST